MAKEVKKKAEKKELPPCVTCQDYHKCFYKVGKDWFTYEEIRNCPYQVIWIIENARIFLLGDWPDCPDGSRHIDSAIKGGFSNEAYFVKAVGIIAEVNKRLQTTGEAGEALVDEIKAGIVYIDDLSRPAYRALMYVKGRRRKAPSYTYSQWKKQNIYRQKRNVLSR